MVAEDSPLIQINAVAGRGLVYDIETVKVLRDKFHISGTLIGILPQIPQQNVFMGLPLELMPEDVEYLVDYLKVAYVVDDYAAHKAAASELTDSDIGKIKNRMETVEQEQLDAHKQHMWEKRQLALEKQRLRKAKGVQSEPSVLDEVEKREHDEEEEKKAWLASISGSVASKAGATIHIPTTTEEENLPTYKAPQHNAESRIVEPPKKQSYDMYKHLQRHGFFLSPGLRFGGHFLAYPGDSLRFHSHYTAIGFLWNEEFNVLDIVGGGRLATSVKKCWVVGAENDDGDYKAYSIEWAGFG